MDEYIKIEGNIIDVIYSNEENGYTVCELDSKEEGVFTAVGYMPYISEGERVSLTGMWVTHPEYGEQFKVDYYESVLPTDAEAVVRYLASGIVPGIREATAIKLVEHFGPEVLDIMLTEPVRLSEIKGISPKKAQKIGEDFSNIQSVQGIILFLQKYKISTNMAIKAHQVLGSNAVEMIKSNPYILSDAVDGISFKTADAIAFQMNIPKNKPERIRSGIKYFLNNSAYSSGHVYLPMDLLINKGAEHLTVSTDEMENEISEMILKKELRSDIVNGEKACYLSTLANAENYVALRLMGIEKNAVKKEAEDCDAIIKEITDNEGITLAPEQIEAVKTSVESGCMVITGGPGTGKTTTINTIIKLLKRLKYKIRLAAPTGRAAKRMSQVCGMETMTIHRLLGVQRTEGENVTVFSHDEENPLDADVIILDEMSMIDISLMQSFLKAVKPGARVIMSGDADQLPSVGPGNVLKDIIASEMIPVIKLKHIFRQAQESMIVVNAHRINEGKMPELSAHDNDFFFLKRNSTEIIASTIVNLFAYRLPSGFNLDAVSDIQVITPSKKGIAGTVSLNTMIQKEINPPNISKQEMSYGKTVFRVGDKVMQTKNNYDIPWTKNNGEEGTGIFNGDMGIIASISIMDKAMYIVFDDDKLVKYDFSGLDEIELAYAITVHKSQGSEFPVVLMPVCSFPPMLMCKNLLYTAVTRAKKNVVMVGRPESIKEMVSNVSERRRYTALCEKLKNMK